MRLLNIMSVAASMDGHAAQNLFRRLESALQNLRTGDRATPPDSSADPLPETPLSQADFERFLSA